MIDNGKLRRVGSLAQSTDGTAVMTDSKTSGGKMDYKGSVIKRIALFLMVVGLAVATMACQGAVGKTGDTGDTGPPGPPGEPPEPVNLAPIPTVPFATVMLMDGGAAKPVDAAPHFHDPEEEALSYSATVAPAGIVSVTQEGSVFTITPDAAGDAVITVTATDPKGKTGTAKINVMVTSEGIMYDGSLPERIALVPGGVETISGADIEGAFEEDEGETPEISVSSSDETIVTAVKGDDNSVTITALDPAGREATVTITATADDGETAEAMITVAVVASYDPQRSDMTPAPVSLTVGDDPHVIPDVSMYFTDPNGDVLTYEAVSGDTTVVSASATDSMVTITAVGAGTATVTVTATNLRDLSVSQMISVTVDPAPVVVPAVTWKKEIPDVTFEHDGAPQMFMLEDYFNDATMYAAMSDDNNVVMAAVNDAQTMLTLTRVGPGTATVEVTPSNSVGDGAAQSITVTVKSPAEVPARPELKPNKMIPATIKVVQLADSAAATAVLAVLDAAETHYDLADLIRDPDGPDADLVFSTTTTDPKTVAVYQFAVDTGADGTTDERQTVSATTLDKMTTDASHITIRGRKAGTATVTIMASSDSGQTVSWPIAVKVVATANNGPNVVSLGFPGTAIEDTNSYYRFVRIGNQERFKSTDMAPRKLKIKLGADSAGTPTSGIFHDPDVHLRTSEDEWEFSVESTNKEVVMAELEPTGKADEYYVVITPKGSGKARIYFMVEDSFGAKAGGKDTSESATININAAAAADGLVDNTHFLVHVNHKPVPYSGDDDEDTPNVNERKSLSTEMQWRTLAAAGTDAYATGVVLIDNPTTTDAAEGYFSDKDGDALLCSLMETQGTSVSMTVATRNAFTLVNPDNDPATGPSIPKLGRTTFRIRCFDRVDSNADGNATDFEYAEDTLTVEVDRETPSVHQ